MSCVDFMYQFYSPYFSYKSPAEDTQKYPPQSLYDAGLQSSAATTGSSFLDAGHPSLLDNAASKDIRTDDKSTSHSHHQSQHHHQHHQQQQQQQQQQPQPKATHYLTANCVLLTYFTGEAATLVDEHFSRALSQPSSYTLDKPPPNNKPYNRSETPLMCHRKLPPSFWNSAYQPPHCTASGSSNHNFASAFGADAYFPSSFYNFHKTWPYHYGSQSHTYPHPQSALSYSGMDATGRLTSHYGSLMMSGPSSLSSRMGSESRHPGQYDLTKPSDAFSGYYSSMGRFGTDMDSGLSGLDLPLQQAKKEHYW